MKIYYVFIVTMVRLDAVNINQGHLFGLLSNNLSFLMFLNIPTFGGHVFTSWAFISFCHGNISVSTALISWICHSYGSKSCSVSYLILYIRIMKSEVIVTLATYIYIYIRSVLRSLVLVRISKRYRNKNEGCCSCCSLVFCL